MTESRPDYIPTGAHWGWVTLAGGERVGAWVDEGLVFVRDPARSNLHWYWLPDELRWPDDAPCLSGDTWDGCKAIWNSRLKAEPKLPADDDDNHVGDAQRAGELVDDDRIHPDAGAPAIDWEARRWELFVRLLGVYIPNSTNELRRVCGVCDAAIAVYREGDRG